jgi:cobalt-zinc-cadmium efflux system membrane fusion protein
MKNALIIVSITLAGVLTGCSSEGKKEETAPSEMKTLVSLNQDQMKNAGVNLGKPVLESVGMTIYANGTMEVPPQNKTVISVQFGGFVKSLDVLDGMTVRKGQRLLTIEHPDLIQLQQDYLEVVGQMEYLKAEMERQKTLYDKDAGSAKAYQQAKAEYQMAAARKSGLSSKLDMAGVNMGSLNNGNIQRSISVVSPFDGVVTKVAVNVGAYADPTEHLLEIIDLKHSHAEVIVFEKDVRFLSIGQKVSLYITGNEDLIEAEVFLIGKEIGRDRTVKVHCHLNEENKVIAPGSYFKAMIHAGESKLHCVPSEAIVELDGEPVIFQFVKKSGKNSFFKPIPVRILITEKEITAFEFIQKGVTFDQTFVLSGAYDIMSSIMVSGEEE